MIVSTYSPPNFTLPRAKPQSVYRYRWICRAFALALNGLLDGLPPNRKVRNDGSQYARLLRSKIVTLSQIFLEVDCVDHTHTHTHTHTPQTFIHTEHRSDISVALMRSLLLTVAAAAKRFGWQDAHNRGREHSFAVHDVLPFTSFHFPQLHTTSAQH